MSYFNVRVYGILMNTQNEVLLSDEHFEHRFFTKFPGGGLELGEGLAEALVREFEEECHIPVQIKKHIYTTDFYEKSSFNDSQIISVYYQVVALAPLPIEKLNQLKDVKQKFRWVQISELQEDMLTFKTDKLAIAQFKEQLI